MTDRLAVLAALADPHRLALVDALADGDLSPGQLAARAELSSSLLAHHLRVLEDAGVVTRRRSDADGRRSYLTLAWSPLVAAALDGDRAGDAPRPARVLFTCTANSARSQLAAAMLGARRIVPVASAGTAPAARIHPLALDELGRRGLEPVALAPAALDATREPGDLVIAVCDLAYEDCGGDLHWSIPDPVAEGTSRAFAAAFDALEPRVTRLAATLASSL
ncbi:metalloregulator ArsR/SmtB family transcription factor [Demequina phytophila]|uniref:metalloregulator ArsR/SmtB family transcription factor n=1 Tax=Demequina phytophila TaxID=1638981 RepID=UPI001E60E5B7|nr:metalloregulator ArsR/SmtB family transcription factor [Demequina phytophila]